MGQVVCQETVHGPDAPGPAGRQRRGAVCARYRRFRRRSWRAGRCHGAVLSYVWARRDDGHATMADDARRHATHDAADARDARRTRRAAVRATVCRVCAGQRRCAVRATVASAPWRRRHAAVRRTTRRRGPQRVRERLVFAAQPALATRVARRCAWCQCIRLICAWMGPPRRPTRR